jgi:RsiW-degrading membrane proteinase PrsW (M82 family)
MNPFEQESKETGGNGLTVSQASVVYLETSAKWARFLAIIGFIGIGLMVLGALILFVVGAAQSGRSSYDGYGYYRRDPFGGFPVALLGVGYLIGAVLYFFPVLYLNNFATRMLNALAMRDNVALESSFEQLRNHYRFLGILTIVMIAVYLLLMLMFAVAGASGGFR